MEFPITVAHVPHIAESLQCWTLRMRQHKLHIANGVGGWGGIAGKEITGAKEDVHTTLRVVGMVQRAVH